MIRNFRFFVYKITDVGNTFSKQERLCSKTIIEKLFAGGAKSFSVFPLRVIFMPITDMSEKSGAAVLLSVPKKKFKRAVKRNRIKRQMREGYRKNKSVLSGLLAERKIYLPVAFVYLDNKLYPTAEIEEKFRLLLSIIKEKLE